MKMVKMRALRNKKGFTMIELIVVLIVLAIMAAFLIPSYIGFVNDARDKQDLTSARACLLAAQIMATEGNTTEFGGTLTAGASGTRFGALTTGITGIVTVTAFDNNQVTAMTYQRESSSVVWAYDGAKWEIDASTT